MKQENATHTSPRFRLNKGEPNDQLHELDISIQQNYEEIKSLKQEKHNLVMKFEVNQKDHSRYVQVKNEIVDTERKRKELEKYHNQLVKMIEGTRDMIQKNTEDSGKEQKVLDIREMIMTVKAQAKELENEKLLDKKKGDKAFDKVMKATEEQKALKREAAFLRGNAGGISDMKTKVDEAYSNKKKADRRDEAREIIKKKHNEILMREKVHH